MDHSSLSVDGFDNRIRLEMNLLSWQHFIIEYYPENFCLPRARTNTHQPSMVIHAIHHKLLRIRIDASPNDTHYHTVIISGTPILHASALEVS